MEFADIKDILARVFAKRDDGAHKGVFGQAVVIGGCKNYVGAPKFAAGGAAMLSEAQRSVRELADAGEGSMRLGAGTSVLAVPDFLAAALYGVVTYSAIFPLGSKNGYIRYVESEVDALLERGTSFAVGMGAGEGETDRIVAHLLRRGARRIVVDADALKRCAHMDFEGGAALTPHFGEMSRMTGMPVESIARDYCNVAAKFASEHNCVVALKCSRTCVTDGKRMYVNDLENARLAKGGSGDVLSGIIAGIAAYHGDMFEAAAAGCYVLSKAAELTEVNEFSSQATDIIASLPRAVDACIAMS